MTKSVPSKHKPTLVNIGTHPKDPEGFTNIVKQYRELHLHKPIRKPTIRKIEKVKINPVCLPLILAQYHKDKQMKKQTPNTNTEKHTDTESITINISDSERHEIDKMYQDMNNNNKS